jgi:hypothetical protein
MSVITGNYRRDVATILLNRLGYTNNLEIDKNTFDANLEVCYFTLGSDISKKMSNDALISETNRVELHPVLDEPPTSSMSAHARGCDQEMKQKYYVKLLTIPIHKQSHSLHSRGGRRDWKRHVHPLLNLRHGHVIRTTACTRTLWRAVW